jgi:anti-anti-sigma regulatory factor
MLRITEINEDQNTVRLRLDGVITDEGLNELLAACSAIRNDAASRLILDMAGVDFMSNQAAQEMTELSNGNCRIINCSPFISTLLDTVTKAKARQ